MTFVALIRAYWNKVCFILACIFLSNLLALALPWGIKLIIDDVVINKRVDLLNMIVGGLLVIVVLRSCLNYFRKYESYFIAERIVCRIRQKMYEHIQTISLKSIHKVSPAQIMTRMTGDLDSMRRFFSGEAVECLYAAFSTGFIITALCVINPKLTLIALLNIPLFIYMYLRMLPELKENYRSFKDIWGQFSSRLNEVFNSLATVKALATEHYEGKRLWQHQQKLLKVASGVHSLNAKSWICMEFFSSLGILAVLWVGGTDVMNQQMTIGQLIAFYSYLGMLFAPLTRIITIGGSYQEASAALERINEIFDIHDGLNQDSSSSVLAPFDGNIEFSNVSFGYSANERILDNISFKINKGETIGIVGASGAGKTTLINLLLRFYDPLKGEITIDGTPLKKIDLNSYRRQSAVVFQDDHLFSGTVQENICYGSFDAPSLRMIHAARLACADEFIDRLPDGYLTHVGDRGLQLSSGQRQRLILARALLRNPSLLILDEATSAVDAFTENQIQQSITQFMKGKTVLIIAHRFSTIVNADKIIVLDKGRIVEVGEHNYLLNKGGFYSSLYLEQFREKDNVALADI